MPLEFDLFPTPTPPDSPDALPVLVTGANGHVGRQFIRLAPDRLKLRLMVQDAGAPDLDALHARGEVVTADLNDPAALRRCCGDIDTVLHLAADPNPRASWESVLANNILGTRNLFNAAIDAKCRRVVFASSIHAVMGHGPRVQVRPGEAVNPQNLYGVSKCFGEALARMATHQSPISAICVRIGAFQPAEAIAHPGRLDLADMWVSPRDLVQLLVRCIDDTRLRFAIFSGLSDSRFNRLDIQSARVLLGYQPQDDSARVAPALSAFDDGAGEHG